MTNDELIWRRAVVFAGALIYWAGVLVQARRVRRHIGHSPNMQPRGFKETLLWIGWLLVIAVWLGQPLLAGRHRLPQLGFAACLAGPISLALGILLTVAGYAATLWCYASMGDTWRVGIDRAEKTTLVTRGPYRVIRHPIYAFQIMMLIGGVLLLPTAPSVFILFLHLVCVLIKAADEEAYLLATHGPEYRDYLARTGRLWPRLVRGR